VVSASGVQLSVPADWQRFSVLPNVVLAFTKGMPAPTACCDLSLPPDALAVTVAFGRYPNFDITQYAQHPPAGAPTTVAGHPAVYTLEEPYTAYGADRRLTRTIGFPDRQGWEVFIVALLRGPQLDALQAEVERVIGSLSVTLPAGP
jgi:hypothetical protein